MPTDTGTTTPRQYAEAIAALVDSEVVAELSPRQLLDIVAAGRGGAAYDSERDMLGALSSGERALLWIASDVEHMLDRLAHLDIVLQAQVVTLARTALTTAVAS